MMKTLVYKGDNKFALEEKPIPEIQESTDVIVKLTYSTICGTDLHILKGDVPTCIPGRSLGHEGVGVVHQTGSAVSMIRMGQRVLIKAISSCAACHFCQKGMPSHCIKAGWLLGHAIDGTQSEYVRIPYADSSLLPVPDNVDEKALVMFSDIIPTGLECGTLNGKVEPASSVAIIGAGPVGLAAIMTSKLYSPALIIVIDKDEFRLKTAKNLGANVTINPDKESVENVVKDLTADMGCDTVIEAVGIPDTFELCQDIVAPGGTIANVGVHGTACKLRLEKLWNHNISITTRLVDTVTVPRLLRLFAGGAIKAQELITHEYSLADIEDAYKTFSAAAEHSALKVLITM